MAHDIQDDRLGEGVLQCARVGLKLYLFTSSDVLWGLASKEDADTRVSLGARPLVHADSQLVAFHHTQAVVICFRREREGELDRNIPTISARWEINITNRVLDVYSLVTVDAQILDVTRLRFDDDTI